MRVIKQLLVPQNTDPKFPFGTVLNETDTEDGSPVVEEIYGDILTNIYKLLQDVGIVPTGTQDNDDTQYQILEALKNLPNTLNDIERVLSLTGTVWSIPVNIDYLPNKYFFIGRAAEDYVVGNTYTFKGTTATEYNLTSDGFKSGDELLIILDNSAVRVYSLSKTNEQSVDILSTMGSLLAFNDTNKIWYQEGGVLMSDMPSVDDLEARIRVDISDVTALVHDIFVIGGKVLCFCSIPASINYFFRQFDLNDLSSSIAVSLISESFSSVVDNSPYVFVENGFVHITNNMNDDTRDYSISKFTYDSSLATLTFVSTVNLDLTFVKGTNTAIKGGFIYTFVLGELCKFNLSSGVKTTIGQFPLISGQIFSFNGFIYYNSGEVSKKWF